MKKFSLLLAALILLLTLAPAASAAETSGTCGEGLTWTFENNTLTISGAGAMDDTCPWEAHKDRIDRLVLTGGVTYIGKSAFEGCDRLEEIDFGDSLVEIGKRAFYDCSDIEEIRLPKTFKRFGEESFRNCDMLTRIICEGNMPSFKSGCMMTDSYISVFFPPNNPWSYEWYGSVMTSYGGRVSFMMASEEIMNNGFPEEEASEETSDEETPEETKAPTEAAAEATEAAIPVVVAEDVTTPEATEATVPETTEATQPPVVMAEDVEPTTAPVVMAEDVGPTEETVPQEDTTLALFTESPEETAPAEEKEPGRSWIGLVMIAGVITFLLAGAMIFRSTNRRNRY